MYLCIYMYMFFNSKKKLLLWHDFINFTIIKSNCYFLSVLYFKVIAHIIQFLNFINCIIYNDIYK